MVLTFINSAILLDKIDRYLDRFNQFCIAICTIFIILFTDYVTDDKIKYLFGWFFIDIIFCNFIIGFMIPFMM